MDSTKNSRWLRLILAVFVLLFAGIIYAWSNISSPLGDMGWKDSALTFNYTLTIWFFCVGGLISGFLSKKVSPQVRLAVSAILLFTGFYITSCINRGDSIAILYIAYGVMAGTGIGIVYNTAIATTSQWFPDKKGICSGALMMGFGIGSFVIGLVAANLMKNGVMEWRSVYRMLGAVSGAALLLGAFLIRAPKAGTVLPSGKRAQGASGSNDFSAGQMLTRVSFWKLFIFFILFSAVGSSAIALAKKFSISINIQESAAIIIASVVSVTNSLGRLVSGALVDSCGLRKTQYISSAVVISAPLLALLGVFTNSVLLGVIGLLLCGFSYGFSPTVSAAFTMEFYGPRNYALNLSIMNLVLIPGAFVPTIASNILASSGGSYIPVFVMLTAFSLVGLVINLFIKRP